MKSAAPRLQGALIDCGYVSRFHLEGWAKVSQARLAALCDRDRQRLEQASAKVPEARLYTDAAALFESEQGLDFDEICTRPDSHRVLVELAARSGVHVLCQKPAALVRPDLEATIKACDSTGIRLMFHENWRFRSWYRALRAEISAGTIGRPIRLRIAHRDTRALRVEGYDDQPYFRTMPRLILLDRFAGGCLGLLDMSWCAPAELARAEWALNETVVEGTAGTLRLLTDGSLEWIGPTGRRERKPVVLPPDDQVYIDGYTATQQHFLNGLITGAEHETRASDTLRTMDVVWTAYRAAEEGRSLKV